MNTALRIAFTGPECSGKTTLCEWLSKELGCSFAQEYAREYLKENSKYRYEDLESIAQGQFNVNQKSRLCDTEMLVMEIWSNVKFQKVSPSLRVLLENQQFDLYFLCKPDFIWEADPLRENPNNREQLFELYVERLKELNWPYCILEGSIDDRKRRIIEILKNV